MSEPLSIEQQLQHGGGVLMETPERVPPFQDQNYTVWSDRGTDVGTARSLGSHGAPATSHSVYAHKLVVLRRFS